VLNAAFYRNNLPFVEELAVISFSLAGVWGSINLFSPSNMILPLSIGYDSLNDPGYLVVLSASYLLRLGFLFLMLCMTYRAALYCSELRLRASDS
jgi:hypothetical protein